MRTAIPTSKEIANQITNHQTLAHKGLKESLARENKSHLLSMSIGEGDQLGKQAPSIRLKHLISLRFREFRQRKVKDLIKAFKKAAKNPGKFQYQDIAKLAKKVHIALNDQSLRLQSNLLLECRNALIQAYLAVFKPLRDNLSFETEEFDNDTDIIKGLKRSIFRLRRNHNQVSVNLTYLFHEDTKAIFSAIDKGNLSFSLYTSEIDSGIATPTEIKSLTIKETDFPATSQYSLFSCMKARSKIAPTDIQLCDDFSNLSNDDELDNSPTKQGYTMHSWA